MRIRRAGIVLVVLLGLFAVVATGCGSSSSSSSGSAASTSAQTDGSKEFAVKGGGSKYVKFGNESGTAEREEVSKIVEASFDAREKHEWAEQCATLAKAVVESVEKNPASEGKKGCAAGLGGLASTASAATLKNNMADPVGAFRVKGTNGYALYHGTDKKDYAVPTTKEGQEWKVGTLVAVEIPGS